jgi:hypothetical protein
MANSPRLPDFDTLARLYREDPEAFETFRTTFLQEVVESSPEEYRPGLRLLLQRIEEQRSTAETPMEALIFAMRMMRESLRQLREGWQDAHYAVAGLQTTILIEKLKH